MKPTTDLRVKFGVAALASGCLLAGLLIWSPAFSVTAQTNQADTKPPAADTKTNSTPATNAPTPASSTNAPAPAGTTNESAAKAEPEKNPDEIQLSFQGANIDMIVQWLAQQTGKSVIKHPQVNCQLNIVSSKKIKIREAINLVYRALALEGFNAVESGNSIFIVPEGKEPKLNPVLLDPSKTEIPEGRERMVKMFPLKNIPPSELKDKLRIVLSDKGTIDVDDRSGQLIITDYTDNLRLLSIMIKELDVASQSDSALEIYAVKHADADELGNLISTILNSQPAPKAAAHSSSRSSGPQMPQGIIFPGAEMPQAPPSDSGGGGAAAPSASLQVKIWPDKAGNRLIVSAPKSKFPEVERMLDILDVEKTKDVTIRSIALKNLTAADMVRELGQMYQRMNQRNSKDDVQIAADEQSNSLLVFSSESNFHALQKLIASLDTEDSQDRITQTFALKNADSQDVAKQLQDLSQDQNNSFPRYVYFSDFGGGNNRANRKKLTVVADRRRNSVVVQAAPAQMPGIAKMVTELDAPVTDDSLAPRIYPLKYVSAADIEDVLNELFLKKTQQRNYFNFFDDYESNSSSPDRDVGRLYGKVRITSEPYSNTLIVTSNSKESLAAVEDVLKQLDQPSQAGETTMRIQLKYGKASDLANNLNILFAKIGSPPLRAVNGQPNQQNNPNPQQQQQNATGASQTGFDLQAETKEDNYYPWLGGQPENTRGNDGKTVSRQVSDLVGRVRVVPDLRANALLISANVHLFPQVLKLVEELDAPTASVLIEARLVEVSTDYLDQLGVRWSPDGSTFTAADKDNSMIMSSTGTYTKGFGGNTSVNNPSSSSAGTVSQLITSLRSGTVNNSISMDFLVQFLHEKTHATVLAEPQLNIKDNEMGRLFVGQLVPVPDNNSYSAVSGGNNTTIRYKEVGVVLEVTPHINSNGDVALKIHAESSSISPVAPVLGGDLFESRAFKTDLTAKSGQTLVVGGIIQKQISETMRKTPILGSIPGLGWAFKKKDSTSQTVELFVFLRPKVIRTQTDGDELLKEVDRRAPLVKKWQDENEQSQSEKQEAKKHGDKDK